MILVNVEAFPESDTYNGKFRRQCDSGGLVKPSLLRHAFTLEAVDLCWCFGVIEESMMTRAVPTVPRL